MIETIISLVALFSSLASLEMPPKAVPAPKAPVSAPAPRAVVKPAPKPQPKLSPVLQMINDTRASLKLNTLAQVSGLNESARLKCNDMITNNYWGHERAGTMWYDEIKAVNPQYNRVGEIISRNFKGNVAAEHAAWLNSPTHREQIVGDYRYFGFATCNFTYNGGVGADVTVVHFGDRR